MASGTDQMAFLDGASGCAFQRWRPAVPGEGDHLFQLKATR
jgi:hypothetical protein